MEQPDTSLILVINCGSSSLKYEVYTMPEKKSLGKGKVERIGLEKGRIEQKKDGILYEREVPVPDHKVAFEAVVEALTDREKGIIGSTDDIDAIGHRVVHGGESYSESVLIDNSVKRAIQAYFELAPLHNPANLTGIHEAEKQFPGVKNVAVFDTAFHQTMPPSAYLYGIPRELYRKYKIRRYGFHGTSHRYVSNRALDLLKRSKDNTNLITCHLGNGASITAIERGRSVDTSMGFTPLEGVIMGTRSGDLDPAIITFLIERGYDADEVNTLLNKKSGLLGLSELSSDMRDIKNARADGNVKARETLEVYAYRIKKYIGAYMANLVKVDAMVFTGGIGENNADIRHEICHRLENIGIVIDDEKNNAVGNGEEGIISADYSPSSILVVPTNEELQIAVDTYKIAFGIETTEV
ncbi:MAG: acetate/propionate family kinase [Spirochaetota bacterium]